MKASARAQALTEKHQPGFGAGVCAFHIEIWRPVDVDISQFFIVSSRGKEFMPFEPAELVRFGEEKNILASGRFGAFFFVSMSWPFAPIFSHQSTGVLHPTNVGHI